MTEMVLYNLMIDVPLATAIWTGMLLSAGFALTLLMLRTQHASASTGTIPTPTPAPGRLPAWVTRLAVGLAEVPRWLGRRIRRRGHRVEQARDAHRYAGEVAVAAARAEQTVRRQHTEWLAVQAEVDVAWQEFDDADQAVRRLGSTATLPTPDTARTPAEYADRERYLHRAAMSAYWRRELTVRQLTDALANRNGWDPRRHPVEQELTLQTVIRDGRYRDYLAAGERERGAWAAVEAARAAARSLRAEAIAADGEAWRLRRWRPPVTGYPTVTGAVHRLAAGVLPGQRGK
ncbi:hypothetical protein [Micromonospora sp. NBC_01813]|uniref:hypothetical protein n=1 Tax=Micromonospora sp. NBC_01813 TaxID=2975988 RepID=UPI002DD8C97D|nr:hypothetical protein [Micromonospora sp. NBC_01813]WSA09403.1 hypothetical protein OG958_00785 [Micromonospora sp. NBC_01813]